MKKLVKFSDENLIKEIELYLQLDSENTNVEKYNYFIRRIKDKLNIMDEIIKKYERMKEEISKEMYNIIMIYILVNMLIIIILRI